MSDRVLVVISREDENAYKSFRNLPDVQVCLAGELNTYDILNNDWIVFTQATLPGVADDGPIATSRVADAAPERRSSLTKHRSRQPKSTRC